MLSKLADVIGKLWALPCTALGLSYGLLAHLFSVAAGSAPRICVGNNAIQFINSRGVLNGTALTLGNVILYGEAAGPECCGAYGDACVNIGRHEQAHTYQYQVLGPVFLLAYCALLDWRKPLNNPFEQAAQRYGAGQGSWWPTFSLVQRIRNYPAAPKLP